MTETACLTGDLRTPGKRRAMRARLARLATATTDIIPSPNYSSRNGTTVTGVVIHTAEGPTDADALGDYFAQSKVQASSHVGIDDTKRVNYVDPKYEAWTLRNGNPWTDNAEMCGFASWTRAQWLEHPGMIRQAAEWVAERCHARGIPPVRITADDIRAGRRTGYFAHWDYTLGTGDGTHWDVGSNFPWDLFGPMVQAAYDGTPTPTPQPVEDTEMRLIQSPGRGIAVVGPGYFRGLNKEETPVAVACWGNPYVGNDRQFDLAKAIALQGAPAPLDPAKLAVAVVAALPPSSGGSLTEADVETAVRKVLGSLDNAA